MTVDNAYTHSYTIGSSRRHLTTSQKQELIKAQLKETPEKSDRQIAKDLGVSPTTVSTTRKKMLENSEQSILDSSQNSDNFILGKDVKRRRKQRKPKEPISVFNPTKREERAMKQAGMRHER